MSTNEPQKNYLQELRTMIDEREEDYVKSFERKQTQASRRLRAKAQAMKSKLNELRIDALSNGKS
jgi:uncharacterized protein YbjQ (UPF0145 family)